MKTVLVVIILIAAFVVGGYFGLPIIMKKETSGLKSEIHDLKEKMQKIDAIPLVVGGTIPKRDREKLKEMGVALIFPTQTPLDEIIPALKEYRLPQKA